MALNSSNLSRNASEKFESYRPISITVPKFLGWNEPIASTNSCLNDSLGAILPSPFGR
uniref:Uncharacterized protein n=1 Tax=Arundo donax TaxID=35708 RepID=A0A0A8XNW9_ARUDO